MPNKSLPGTLRKVLEDHVIQSKLTHDKELQGIIEQLTNLNDKVEMYKAKIMHNRQFK
jgi:hypothetical protein